MSHSNPQNLIACFRNTINIIQTFDSTRNAIDIHEIKRFSPEIFVKYSASILEVYIEKFFNDFDFCIDYKYTLNINHETNSPLEVLLFARLNKIELPFLVIDELRFVVNYGLSLTQDNSDLFDIPDNTIQLSKEKAELVEELAQGFLEKHGGKNISKPFEWTVDASNSIFTPFQGRIRTRFIKNEIDESDFILTAKLDGFKNSEMLIYLQEIDSELKLLPTSVPYKVVKSSLIKSAAEIYSKSSPAYVTVTAFKKADEKGSIRFYVRDISSFQFDELTELSLSS